MGFFYKVFKIGYGEDGFNREGFDRDGFDQHGYDRNGYSRDGFNREGFDRDDFDRHGYGRNGYSHDGFNREGFDRDGFDRHGYDRNGYSRDGFNCEGFNREGFNDTGYDKDGYDQKGYNRRGYSRDGYGRDGYDRNGYDRNGYSRYGFNREGFNREGFNTIGYSRDGYDREGYDRSGYSRDGYDRHGYNRGGYSRDGYNSDGYNRDGFNCVGFNKDGYNREGYNISGYSHEEMACGHLPPDGGITNTDFRVELQDAKEVHSGGITDDAEISRLRKADFDSIEIGLASPEQIRKWSYGEVKKPETINYRTLKPERDGLFCEKIFGPTKDWECHCGKYKKIRYKGKVCDRCGVEVTRAKVRRERMGHIELAAPVSHIWYFKGIPSRMGLLLDISPHILEKVLYFASYIVTDSGFSPLAKNQILSEKEYRDMREKYEDDFQAGMGAEAVKQLLDNINLEELSEQLRADLKDAAGQKKARIVKRLEVVDAFRLSGNKPSWMIIDVLPVIPPEIRPVVQLDGGRFAASDLNDLYRRVINCNNRLKHLIQIKAPDIVVRIEKKRLQEAVDALIDNGRRGRAVTGVNNCALKSLSDMLKGKQGRFRQNLLGKRVDYSGRSVIVVGPEMKIYQCGLPKEMAIELFRPFVMKKLVEDSAANNIKSAKKMVDKGKAEVWDALEFVIKEHPVMLNRAPTLHRLGIQAFEPVLVEGRAIKLHPLVSAIFNTSFDGDQMTVHVPISAEAQAEARILMLSSNNLLNPMNGSLAVTPQQDIVLGIYYLTYERYPAHGPEVTFEDCAAVRAAIAAGEITEDDYIWVRNPGSEDDIPTYAGLAAQVLEGELPVERLHAYSNDGEARLAYDEGELELHVPILVRRTHEVNGERKSKLVRTTVGRLIFNDCIPQDLGFVDRENLETMFDPEINFTTGKKQMGKLIDKCIVKHGFTCSAEILDKIKSLGFKYATQSGITIAMSDFMVPQEKNALIAASEQEIIKIEHQFKHGFLTDDERYRLAVATWEKTNKEVTDALMKGLDRYNPIWMMTDSGAGGSSVEIRQLAGMGGLMADTSGRAMEIPIKSNICEGLTTQEYFISSLGMRKDMTNTFLTPAYAFHTMRNLVYSAQEVVVREHDCSTHDGILVSEIRENGQVIETFGERLKGRNPVDDIVDPNTGNVLIPRDHIMTADDAQLLEANGIYEVMIRSVLTCEAKSGVCSKCYGVNLATAEQVDVGEAIGIIAAQSIGGLGLLLAKNMLHAHRMSRHGIHQSLARVEELFEAHKPRRMAQLAEFSGRVSVEEAKRGGMCSVSIIASDGEVVTYALLFSAGIRVKDGDWVEKGVELTYGDLYPQDVLRICGVSAVQNYLIQEIQKPYRQQGIDINDKHIEVICRQMMRKVRVEDPGDSELLSGSTVDIIEFKDAVREIRERIADGKNKEGMELREPKCTRLLLGISKAGLATDSFLSAAALRETAPGNYIEGATGVLAEAAIKGKVERLLGTMENVIIGKLIPAGTGLTQYDNHVEDGNDESPVSHSTQELMRSSF